MASPADPILLPVADDGGVLVAHRAARPDRVDRRMAVELVVVVGVGVADLGSSGERRAFLQRQQTGTPPKRARCLAS